MALLSITKLDQRSIELGDHTHLLVDGCVRDVAELSVTAIGIRALALMPLSTERRHVGQVDLPVQVQGVCVRPGDWVVADADGIVVMKSAPAA